MGRENVPCGTMGSPIVGESVPIHKPERKVNGCLGTTRRCFQTCVLGLPGQVNKFDSNRPLLTVWDCLTLLLHRVRSER